MVSLATMATQAGLAWLRRRAEASDRPPLPATKGTEPAIPEHLVYQSFEEMYATASGSRPRAMDVRGHPVTGQLS